MSVEYTQVFYTGEQWVEITYKPILNDNGSLSGHYEELSRRQIIDFGLFDDEVTLNDAIANILIFRGSTRNDFYTLSGFKDIRLIFQAYNVGASDLAATVINFLREQHLVITEFTKFVAHEHETIEFKCYVRELEGKPEQKIYTLKLESFDDSIIKVA